MSNVDEDAQFVDSIVQFHETVYNFSGTMSCQDLQTSVL